MDFLPKNPCRVTCANSAVLRAKGGKKIQFAEEHQASEACVTLFNWVVDANTGKRRTYFRKRLKEAKREGKKK